MDGKLKSLKELIKKADIDVIESFTFPEGGGDLSLEEARADWKDKSIIASLPAFLYLKEEKMVKRYIYNLINRASSKKNFMLEISEDLPHKTQEKELDGLPTQISFTPEMSRRISKYLDVSEEKLFRRLDNHIVVVSLDDTRKI